jgi:hypothetical protein
VDNLGDNSKICSTSLALVGIAILIADTGSVAAEEVSRAGTSRKWEVPACGRLIHPTL